MPETAPSVQLLVAVCYSEYIMPINEDSWLASIVGLNPIKVVRCAWGGGGGTFLRMVTIKHK